MSDTERTDAEEYDASIRIEGGPRPEFAVSSDFARALERALTAERAARERTERECKELLALAYIGEEYFPDLTWKARANELITDLRKAEAERDALREDAERYRWLRNEARTVDWSYWIEDRAFIRHCRIEADRMDAAIDAARKERP